MASTDPKPDHLERTATEPRDKSLNTVVLRQVDEVNDMIRLFRLEVPKDAPPIRFLPGQWLDVFVPGVDVAGGFTITSTPAEAGAEAEAEAEASRQQQQQPGYLELAVQRSPDNPPAAWLWRDPASIVGAALRVRVGGSFVWPPPDVDVRALRRVVFVAGGVGINPLMSMLGSLARRGGAGEGGDGGGHPFEVHFLYSVRDTGERDAGRVLFLERLASIYAEGRVKGRLRLFLTGRSGEGEEEEEEERVISCRDGGDVAFCRRRVNIGDVAAAVDNATSAVVYVCGVPSMTDEFVQKLTNNQNQGLGMEPHRVLCEKWW
ncbi:NADH-cytochrome b-5 reductase [Biscogniauxia mediterranea]|nr:NADH-cytochrome b-5 reductase [Biscogniauxia mediterranea]